MFVAFALAVGACAVQPPLSRPAPAPPSAIEAPLAPAPLLPAPLPPLGGVAPPTVPLAIPPPAVVAPATSTSIALILPLDSAAYGRAAAAVKDGFIAAAARAGASSRVQVIAHGDNDVLPAFAAAAKAGVALAVGPLTRDDLKTVLAMAPRRPRTLALNQTDDGEPLPDAVYALTLAVEQDAVLLVRIAREQGAASIAVVASDGSFQQRFAQAFIAEWRRAGGGAPRAFRFDASPERLGSLRRELSDDRIDAVLLAVDGNDAALAKAFLPRVRVYASSQVTDGLPVEMLYDLEGVQYIETPWLADPQNPAFAGIERGEYDNPFLQRLYALGIDGFSLAQVLAEPTPPANVELDGATGHLSLSSSRIFAREGRLMTIHDGRVLAEPPAQ